MANLFDQIGGWGDKLSEIGSGDLGFLSSILNRAGPFMTAIFYAIIFAGVALVVWKFHFQYKVRIRVIRKSGGKIIDITNDKAKILIDDQGKRKLVLWKFREGRIAKTLPVPNLEYKYKLGKFDYYDLWMDDNGNLHPDKIGIKDKIFALYSKKVRAKIKEIEEKQKEYNDGVSIKAIALHEIDEEREVYVKPMPQERKAWDRYEDKVIQDKYKSKEWMEKYGSLAVTTVLGTTVILVMFFMFKMLGSSMNALAERIGQVASFCGGIG